MDDFIVFLKGTKMFLTGGSQKNTPLQGAPEKSPCGRIREIHHRLNPERVQLMRCKDQTTIFPGTFLTFPLYFKPVKSHKQ